jgi:O-antigen ligase
MKKFFSTQIKNAHVNIIMLCIFIIPIFYNPSFIHSFTQGKELAFKILMLLTAIFILLQLVIRKQYAWNQIWKSSLFLALLISLCVFSVTNALSDTPLVSFFGTQSRGFGFEMELYYFFFAIFVAFGLTAENIPKVLKVSFISAVLVALYACIQKLGWDPFFSHISTNIFAGRSFSFSGNPSYLGQFMSLHVIVGAYFMRSEKKIKKKLLLLVGLFLIIAALIFSGTRAAMFALAFAILLISIKYITTVFRIVIKHKKIVLAVLLCAVVFSVFLPKNRYSFSESSLRSLYSRFEIWKGAIQLIQQKPSTGYGDETFYIYFPEVLTKKFMVLEEYNTLAADRVHNETLEVLFSHGVFGLIAYLILFAFILTIFFRTKNELIGVLCLLFVANTMQNQLAFPDATISVFIAFVLGSLVLLQVRNEELAMISPEKWKRYALASSLVLTLVFVSYYSVYKVYRSQLAYAASKAHYTTNYDIAINKHKEALSYTPYYSEFWYELMMIDPSSMGRALINLEQIEGLSGNVLAWKGNYYSSFDREKAGKYYLDALEKNPLHPDWIRAYADMLYKYEDYDLALFMYDKFLKSIPDFWLDANRLDELSLERQRAYKVFMHHLPFFWGTVDKIEELMEKVKEKTSSK